MTRKERKKQAVQLLLVRWALITMISLLTVSGIYHFDKFQGTKVIAPLFELWQINDGIRYYKEMEGKYAGYTDTTKYSDEIRKLSKERKDNFYNNEDEVISYVCTRFSLVKAFYFVVAIVLVIAVTILPIFILFGLYWDAWDNFRRKWKRIKESKVVRHVDHHSFQKFERKVVNFR